jgi:hypothetical protein
MAALLGQVRLRLLMLLLAIALLMFGLLLPGCWFAGLPLGVGIGALTVRHFARQSNLAPLPPTLLSAILCYACAAPAAVASLMMGAFVSHAVRRGPGYEETIMGVALGFFLYLTYRLVRWGRALQPKVRQEQAVGAPTAMDGRTPGG